MTRHIQGTDFDAITTASRGGAVDVALEGLDRMNANVTIPEMSGDLIDRVPEKVRTLAAVTPALVRLLDRSTRRLRRLSAD